MSEDAFTPGPAAAYVREAIAQRTWERGVTPDLYRRMGDVLAQHAEMFAEAVATSEAPTRMQAIMRREGLKLDDLNDPMQKLAFTFYTELCERASKADELLSRIRGES